MADLEAFRAETRSWLEANAPAALRGRAADVKAQVWGGKREPFAIPESRTWLERMVERGWTAPTWPTEYGGGGLSPAEGRVVEQEIRALDLPLPLIGFGLNMIGPTLFQFGSEELRREHLPKIVRGEIRWCQGYSEPNAGSDLASLATSARPDGDDYIVNGQKVWTTYGDYADWIFMLVRTDTSSKQGGITFLLVDMETPGVSVRPIKLISGASPFCETFFENVRVPRANVVGQVNAGWTVAKALLGHERKMIADVFGVGSGRGGKASLVDVARRYVGPAGDGPIADPVLRDRIAQVSIDQTSFELTLKRAADGAKAGRPPGPESSLFKIYGTELNQRREELGVELRGLSALGWEGPGYDALELQKTRDWLRSRGNSIEGGTSEVQLNIIAKRVLGLPD